MSTDGKHWWEYVDSSVTLELLDGEKLLSIPNMGRVWIGHIRILLIKKKKKKVCTCLCFSTSQSEIVNYFLHIFSPLRTDS